MTSFVIHNARLMLPHAQVRTGSVLVREGSIAEIGDVPEVPSISYEYVNAAGELLTPGLIDLHTHGIHEYSYEGEPSNLLTAMTLLGRYGTTTICPTLYTILQSDSLKRIEHLTTALQFAEGANVPGFHLEGPFLTIPGAGGRTRPGDLGLLEELLSAAGGRVRVMSVSPDCPGIIPVIERLRANDITVFMTHTKASVAETTVAMDAGARHATHFYDVFPAPCESDPGVRPVGAVEAILCDPRCTVDFICDGVHADPLAIKLAIAAKGASRVVAITDSNIGAGLENGVYPTDWGYSIKVSPNNAARVSDANHPLFGALAGSSLTMDRAIANLSAWLDIPAHEIWAMGTRNPADVLNLPLKGRLEVGADADLVLWHRVDGQLKAARTWLKGECIYNVANLESATR